MTPAKKFFGGLESLRGLAAMIVVLLHIKWPNPLTHLLFFRNGYLMVDLFFVLSGFVICHNYRQKIPDFKAAVRFMFLRFGRLYPLHLFCLVCFLAIEVAKYVAESKFHFSPYASPAFSINNTRSFIANIFLVQAFCPFAKITFNGPSWSISTEFFTYLMFALTVLASPKRKSLVGSSVFFIVLAAFLLIFSGVSGFEEVTGWCFVRCFLGFFTGVLAYHIYERFHFYICRVSGKAVISLLAILILYMSSTQNSRLMGVFILPIYFGLLVAIAAEPPGGGISKILECTPLRWLGKVSYSIYMTHLMIVMFVTRCVDFTQSHFNPDYSGGIGIGFIFVALALVFSVSHLTYHWIEKPFQNRFRSLAANRFFKANHCLGQK